jgi:PAS domain S-box-containing protein
MPLPVPWKEVIYGASLHTGPGDPMDRVTRRVLIILVIVVAVHWVLDGVYLYTSQRAGEINLPAADGPSLTGALVLDVPRSVLLGRVTFAAAMIALAAVAVASLRRAGRRESDLLARLRDDLADRRRTEDALALSERRLRLIADNMQEILWLRVGDEVHYLNPAFERVFGVAREKVAGGGLRAWLPWIHPEDRDRVRLVLDDAVAHHAPLDEEFRIRRPDGGERWLHARTVHVETDPDGTPLAVGVAADVTGRRRAEDALRSSAARYRSLYESAHVGITITDLGGAVLYANPAAAEIYGAGSVRELLVHARQHDGVRSFFQEPGERERFLAELQRDPRHRASRVLRMRRLDGRQVELHVSGGLLHNPETGRQEIFAILEDVTERLGAERELRRSEERYRRLVEFLPEGVLVHDGAEVIFANPAAARLLGGESADLAGHPLDDLVAPQHRRALAAASPAPDGPVPVRGPDEVLLCHRSGTLVPAEVSSLPLADATGPRTLTVLKDLTRIHQAGEEIAAQQEILVALIETMPLGIVAKDLDHDQRYVVWNAYMEQQLGIGKDTALGRTDRDLFGAEMAAELRRQDQTAASRGLPQDLGELTLELGERRLDLHVVKVPVRDADGRVTRVFSLVENVTRQKQLQARVQQASKMEAVGRLAGAVAHDFNNMLQVVQGYAETIQQGLPEQAGLTAEVAQVLNAVGRARELVARLLAYSRYDALQPEMLDPGRVLSQLVALARGALPPDVELVVRQGEDLPTVYADPQQLEQALLNLVLNARDALPGQGRIELEVAAAELDREFCATRPWARPGRYVQFTVRDNGCGIPPDAREHVYQPFYTTKGFGQGTGLGLATTYNICKQHQGYIDFDSELDVGTSFHLFLPVPQTAEPGEQSAREAVEEAPGRGELLLLVEDDDMVRALTRQILERAGYRVLEARDGEDAMEVFMAHAAEIELLVLDVVMPRMDGRLLYDNISELRPGVPVLFCSSYSADLLESEYMLQVGGELLAKPYRAADLLRRVRGMLDQAAG